jgi:hypothetical protein
MRVIVLLDEDIDEDEWLQSAASNEPFAFLADEAEDIYSDDAPRN